MTTTWIQLHPLVESMKGIFGKLKYEKDMDQCTSLQVTKCKGERESKI